MKLAPETVVVSTGSGPGARRGLSLARLQEETGLAVSRLPYCHRILLENLLWIAFEQGRAADLVPFTRRDGTHPIPFRPARILMQDFTGVPCIVDLAALREALLAAGTPLDRTRPRLPVHLVIDHSVQLEHTASPEALQANLRRELQRNTERYRLLKWSAAAFKNLHIFPPGSGICHQINLERLSSAVHLQTGPDGAEYVRPDTVLGTDSHTTTVNALGVLGWGVGGIEAEAVMMGEILELPLPPVTGVRLVGRLPPDASATDLALMLTRRLREAGVVGHMVEFFGEGVSTLSLTDRVPAANMAPEYGATAGFFPPDSASLQYLEMTGRDPELLALARNYLGSAMLFRTDPEEKPDYDRIIEFDLRTVRPVVAGPRRPHEVIPVSELESYFSHLCSTPPEQGGLGKRGGISASDRTTPHSLRDGDVVIASITSCTNTSSPALLIAAGLLAKRAVEAGLRVPPHVRTSFAPGSRAAVALLRKLDLLQHLESLGFHACAFGCATCIGNSGPLPDPIARTIREKDLVAAAVLSGNRNFEARIHPLVRANFLCSPAMVVAFALQGHVRSDPLRTPLPTAGGPVRLGELWPTADEIRPLLDAAADPRLYQEAYAEPPDPAWEALEAPADEVYRWDPGSTYIRKPPYFEPAPDCRPLPVTETVSARCLLLLGDFVTTDHISPAGAIAADSPAGRYLREHGVAEAEFNTYGSRRGNHEVMLRGAFANPRLRNRMVARPGGWTRHHPSGEEMTVYDAAVRYRREGVPLVIVAGRMYGAGSSRDWAAKATALLGVRAVIAQSYERIHRSNLVEMGVLPLEFHEGDSAATLGLTGEEIFHIRLDPGDPVPVSATVRAISSDGREIRFPVRVRVATAREWEYLCHGGILPLVYCRLRTFPDRA